MISSLHGLNLPDPLVTCDGQPVDSVQQWTDLRRPEILQMFEEHMYGRVPDIEPDLEFEKFEESHSALSGKAIRRQVRMKVRNKGESLDVDILLYLPLTALEKPVPVFLLLNFGGNHTIRDDPGIALYDGFLREKYRPREEMRGVLQQRYPVEQIIDGGYGLATVSYCGLAPDNHEVFQHGLHGLFDDGTARGMDDWGSISAWAWGLSRIMDYLETDGEVDSSRVAVLGHSRLGKTALWAGALDPRFSIVISNDSGCSGAAIARNRKGETVKKINDAVGYWFCENYKAYNDKEELLPMDQHMLIALMAPRPVYVASATEDLWSDPEGEFMACLAAEPVYRLFGLKGVGGKAMPNPDTPLNTGHIGYHIRTGKHDLTAYDWKCYMDFAGCHWVQDR